MRNSLTGLAALVMVAAPLVAADFWETKPVGEWTREETQQFLRNSPWVRQVAVSEASEPAEARPFPSPTREAGREPASREGVPFEPAPGTGSRLREVVYSMGWSSARIMRQAVEHLNAMTTGAAEAAEPAPLDVYLVKIGGADLKAFDGFAEAELKAAAYLRPRASGGKIEPAEVRIQRDPNGRIDAVEFTFPRQLDRRPAIAEQEKSVEFFCKAGDLKLKAKFDLAKMVTPQGRDL